MNGTSCIYVDSDSAPEFFRASLCRARTEHQCCECGDAIEPGQLHEYAVGKWEGWLDSYRTCARCVNVRDEYFDGWLFERMVEDFYEAHGVDYREGIPPEITPCRARSVAP